MGWIRADGLTPALDRLALLLLVVALPLVAAVLRSGPERFGLHPDGEDPDAPAHTGASDMTPDRTWERREVLRTRTFQTLATAYGLILTCQVATSMHLLSFLRERLDAETAALGVSALALGSFLGRLTVGPLADRVPKRHLAAGLFAFQGAMVAILAGSTGRIPLLAASLGFGVTVGNIFMLQSLLVAELFGRLSFATAMGMQQVVSQVASGCGPLLLGLLVGVHGGYPTALLWLAAGAACASVLITRVRPPEPARG
jgi:predicted MFS family arabinose efflux permease